MPDHGRSGGNRASGSWRITGQPTPRSLNPRRPRPPTTATSGDDGNDSPPRASHPSWAPPLQHRQRRVADERTYASSVPALDCALGAVGGADDRGGLGKCGSGR
jgi:hypothetical protein